MADTFSFGGGTIVAPGFLLRSTVSANRVLTLLPFGTICMVGASDGGLGGGTIYRFNSISIAKSVLRNGPLLTALQVASELGGAAGFVAVSAGAKTKSATAALPGSTSSSGVFTTGDAGAYTLSFGVKIATGTTSGVCVTFKYLDSSGNTQYIGGPGTRYDNLATWAAILAVMAADTLITPAAGTGYQPLFTLAVTGSTSGVPTATSGYAAMTGGTGSGTQTLAFSDYSTAVAGLVDIPFDIGHLVGAYDQPSQAYADGQAQQVAVYGYLRSWVHQCQATGASASQTKVQNSAAVVAAGVAAAQALNSRRSSMCAQQLKTLNITTGITALVDAAWVYCGLLALKGATGDNGPASPLTYEYPSTVADVDYPILRGTGDMDNAVAGGLVAFERASGYGLGSVRVVQSVTTAPNDSSGNSWFFSEVSVQRCSDALQANIKGALESPNPKTIGTGATVKSITYAISVVVDLLEQAVVNNWLTSYDPTSLAIIPSGVTGNDFIVKYSASPVLPINHLGLDQTFEPFQVPVSLGGSVNG